jgi:hypothetical protein
MSEHEKPDAEHPAITKLRAVLTRWDPLSRESQEICSVVHALIAERRTLRNVSVAMSERIDGYLVDLARAEVRIAEMEAELDGRQAAALVTALQSENTTLRTLLAELEAVDVALRDCGFPEAPTRAERLRLATDAAECNADALAMLEPERDRLAALVAELEAENEALRGDSVPSNYDDRGAEGGP